MPDPEQVAIGIDDFEQRGAKVEYRSVDVGDDAGMKALIEDLYTQFGAIHGVLHGAGVIEDKLARDKISCTVVDPRTTSPLDTETILETVSETGRVVIVDEAHPRCNMATDISALVTSNLWDKLKAAPQLVTAPHAPVPFSPALEDLYIPTPAKIEAAVRAALGKGH